MRPFSLLALAILTACSPQRPAGADRGQELFTNCVACHGEDGAGDSRYLAPNIAGLPAWYVETELTKFRDHIRGNHPDDAGGLRMAPMLKTLHGDEDIAAVAAYVASLPRPHAEATLDGDAARGASLYSPCVACHGEDGTGDEAQGAPPLAGASDWYLLTQLGHFKAGVRGADPRDESGGRMRAMASGLADEQAMKDVVAHISTLGR